MHRLATSDVALLLATHSEVLGGDRAVDHVEPLDGGTWSQAFGVTSRGEHLVARFGGDLVGYEKDALASGWSSPGLPVPEVLEIGASPSGCFALTRRVRGEPIDRLDEDGWHRTLPALLRALDELARVDLAGTGFGPFDGDGHAPQPTWADWLLDGLDGLGEVRVRGWRRALEAVPGAAARYDAGCERFVGLVGVCPELRRAVHTDLGAGNTLAADGELAGIIDWGNAVAGDPLYDVAHLTYWAPWHPGCPEAELRQAALDAFGGHDHERRVLAYELHVSLGDQRFNAAMGRHGMLGPVADRADELAARHGI